MPSKLHIPLVKRATLFIIRSLLKKNTPNQHALLKESTPNSYVQPKREMLFELHIPSEKDKSCIPLQKDESHIPLENGGTHLVIYRLPKDMPNPHNLLEKSTPNPYVQPKGETHNTFDLSERATPTNFCFLLKGTKSYRDIVFQMKIHHDLYFQPKGGTPSESDIPLEKKRTKSHRDVVREFCHDSYVQPKGGTVPFRIADLRLCFDLTQLIFAFSVFYALAFFFTIGCTNLGTNFAAALL